MHTGRPVIQKYLKRQIYQHILFDSCGTCESSRDYFNYENCDEYRRKVANNSYNKIARNGA